MYELRVRGTFNKFVYKQPNSKSSHGIMLLILKLLFLLLFLCFSYNGLIINYLKNEQSMSLVNINYFNQLLKFSLPSLPDKGKAYAINTLFKFTMSVLQITMSVYRLQSYNKTITLFLLRSLKKRSNCAVGNR